jgi:hypothetical protein
MRYYLGKCEMKWSHKDRMEMIWVRRQLGEKLFKEVNQDHCRLEFERSVSEALPGDIYKQVDIYVEIEDTKLGTLFALRYAEAIPVFSNKYVE